MKLKQKYQPALPGLTGQTRRCSQNDDDDTDSRFQATCHSILCLYPAIDVRSDVRSTFTALEARPASSLRPQIIISNAGGGSRFSHVFFCDDELSQLYAIFSVELHHHRGVDFVTSRGRSLFVALFLSTSCYLVRLSDDLLLSAYKYGVHTLHAGLCLGHTPCRVCDVTAASRFNFLCFSQHYVAVRLLK